MKAWFDNAISMTQISTTENLYLRAFCRGFQWLLIPPLCAIKCEFEFPTQNNSIKCQTKR